MKTKKKIFLAVILTLVFAFSACGKKAEEKGNDVIIETKWSACDVNMVYSSGYSIMIPYAFNGDWPEIELVRIEGENIDKAEISFRANRGDELPRYEYNGYRLAKMGIGIVMLDSDFTITGLVLSVNGSEQTVSFENPLSFHSVKNSEYIEGMCSLVYQFNGEYILDRGVSYYTFPFEPTKNVTITGAEFSEGYKYKLTSQGKQMTFPLKVSAGERVELTVEAIKEQDIYATINDFVVHYTDDEGEHEHYYLFAESIDDDVMCEYMLKAMTGGK